MQRDGRKRIHEFENEVAIAGGIDAVDADAVKAELFGNSTSIQSDGGAGDRAGTERAHIHALAAVRQALSIAQKHFDIGEQPVRYQYRLGVLQVRIGGHRRTSCLLSAGEQRIDPVCDLQSQIINTRSHIETQIGGNLLVAASASVQLVPNITNDRDQLLLDKVMHILSFIIVKERGR